MNNLDTIDRLVEFGLGVAVAEQMIRTMNQSIASMTVPGAGVPIPEPASTYHVVIDCKQVGPFTLTELKPLIVAGKLRADTLLWTRGLPAWKMAADIPVINKLLMLHPPAMAK